MLGEPSLGEIDVVRRPHAEAEPGTGRLRTDAQRDAVVHELLVPTEVQDAGLLGGDVEADEVDPEGPGPAEVGDDEVDVRGAHDVRSRCPHHAHVPSLGPSVSTLRDRSPARVLAAARACSNLRLPDIFGPGSGRCRRGRR